jgi:hypothetical protein
MLVLVAFCGLAFVLTMALWATSITVGSYHKIPCPGASLAIGWEAGSLRVGALDREDVVLPRPWWSRSSGPTLEALGPGLDVRSNIWGWAISIPFPLLLLAFSIPPLWWLVVYRARAEHTRRVEQGLCLNCGYDARQSTGNRCSECGQNPRQLTTPA